MCCVAYYDDIYEGKLFRGLKKGICVFLIEHLVEKQFFRVVLFEIHCGSRAARMILRILLKVPAPTGSITMVRGVPVRYLLFPK